MLFCRERTPLSPSRQGRAQDFSLGAKAEGPEVASGVWGSLEGVETPSPPATESGERCELPQPHSGPPKGFPLFSALRMASPDTIILSIVDYHAATKIPVPRPLAYVPGSRQFQSVTHRRLRSFQSALLTRPTSAAQRAFSTSDTIM